MPGGESWMLAQPPIAKLRVNPARLLLSCHHRPSGPACSDPVLLRQATAPHHWQSCISPHPHCHPYLPPPALGGPTKLSPEYSCITLTLAPGLGFLPACGGFSNSLLPLCPLITCTQPSLLVLLPQAEQWPRRVFTTRVLWEACHPGGIGAGRGAGGAWMAGAMLVAVA